MIEKLNKKLSIYSKELDIPLQDLSILLSFSGGVDSTVLAYLLLKLRENYGFKLTLMHFNYHAHIKADHCEKFCRSFSKNNNVDFYTTDLFINQKDNFESTAREKRYNELKIIAKNIDSVIILTAHHLDDQIETLFMKMLDNSDWISKIGIREKLGKLRRPLLNVRKEQIIEFAKNRKLSWIEDPTNNDLSIRRNLVRKSLLPTAIKSNKKIENQLLIDAHSFQLKLHSFISEFNKNRDKFVLNNSLQFITINLEEIKNYKLEKLKIFVYWCFSTYFKITISDRSRNYWVEFIKYLQYAKTGSIFKLGSMTFILNREELILISNFVQLLEKPKKVGLTHNKKWYGSIFKFNNSNSPIFSKNKNKITITDNILSDGLYLRRWKKGDKIISSNSAHHILLSNLFINNKISKIGKLMHPIVVDKSDNIVWVPGLVHAKLPIDSFNGKVLKWIPV
tara:strand:+ start:4142 stop:5494 length:1353 start_codon:yes stop_codon:yes gene_type:complete